MAKLHAPCMLHLHLPFLSALSTTHCYNKANVHMVLGYTLSKWAEDEEDVKQCLWGLEGPGHTRDSWLTVVDQWYDVE